MKHAALSIRLLVVVLTFALTRSYAAVESTIASRSGNLNAPITANSAILLTDQWYPFPAGWNNIFRVKDATADVVLRYDDSKRTYTSKAWQIDVVYTIKTWDASNTPTTTTGQTLTITYDPREGLHYVDRDRKQYANAHSALLTVNTVTYTEWSPAGSGSSTTSSTIPSWLDDVYLDLELHVERYYNLTTASLPTLTLTENTTTNELDVSWNYVQGAESYDLEWLFIDVGNATAPFTGSYDYDWTNATRVNVPNQNYSIPLTFPKGILLVRVRGVGIDWNNYVNNGLITRGEADWTASATTGNTSTYTSYRFDIQAGFLPAMNWAYSAGFAEDGKRIDGAQFYDGMMRGREAVTTVNSDGTVLVSDGAYDFEGRPAVSFLAYPETNNGIKFYQANAAYDCQSFDQDDLVNDPAAMGTGAGSGAYYSNASTSGMDGYTPDAGHYPYSRVTYMSDGTNRPATSAAAGDNLKEGSGRETHYFYGTPTQHQLDRLFGNEAGYATHYKKNFVVDPNGVVSVAYIDQHGRVVATALAGEAPANLEPIDNPNNNPNSVTGMTDDLLVNNVQRTAGDGTESQFTLTVTESSLHTFTYTVGSVCYEGTCYTTCVGCKYDLVIMITTPSGDSIDINTASGDFALRYSNLGSGTYAFSAFLEPGTYRVTKVLTLNQGNLDQVRQDYLTYAAANAGTGACPATIAPSPVPCAGDCHTACENHYKRLIGSTYHYYYDDGTEITDPNAATIAQDLIDACKKTLCDQPATPDPCEVKRQAMIDDLSPGGQYFDNLPDKWVLNTTTGQQTFNAEYNQNGWLETGHSSEMLAAINAVWNGTDFTTWNQVRDNWDPAFAEAILEWHPEYCAWNYFCNWNCEYTPPGQTTVTYGSTDAFNYEQATTYETDGNYSGSDGYYWNPLNMPVNDTTHVPSINLPNDTYLPYGGSNNVHLDPRFAGSCDIQICASPSTYAEATLENYLKNFLPAYDENNTLIGYYSAWYVALDPDNIAGGGYNSDLNQATLDVFTALHGTGGLISATPSSGQITPYQFFRSVYFYYRTLVIEQGFAGDANVASCQGTHENDSTLYDGDGYLVSSTNNPILSSQGFTILYPRNPLIDIYGDGCNTPSSSAIADSLSALVDAGSANPDSINLVSPTDGGCSCQMLRDYVTSRGLDSTDYSGIAASLNDELGVSTYTGTLVSGWYTECHTSDPTVADLTSFPEELTCTFGTGISDVATAVQTNCEQENGDLADYNAYVTYQNQLNAAADAYMAAYVSQCVGSASESFSVSYDLHEYYYTLYYYDQAGNLVKTVPPEGVNIINLGGDVYGTATYGTGNSIHDSIDIRHFRENRRLNGYASTTYYFCPAVHDMKSVYAYNSLQQPVSAKQNNLGNSSTYESGETSFWYDYLGRLVVSQNSKQAAMSPKAYSYTLYDALGRITEVGQVQTNATLTTGSGLDGSRQSNDYYFYNNISSTYLESWIAGGTKTEVTYTYYDEAWSGTSSDVSAAFGSPGQENLRNRVSAVVYDDNPASTYDLYGFSVSGQPGHLSAFYYSYDVHGNVKTAVQETPPLKTHNQNVKTTSYEYDLVSGNVDAVYYQKGQRDEFDHQYEYDADNRLHASYSSRDGKTWEKESKQFYYKTGGMGRVEIGDKTVQGLDYAYTINGWFKGMNRNTIGDNGQYMNRDMGQDAVSSASNLNQNFGADAAGFTLQYWIPNAGNNLSADYTPTGTATASFQAATTGSVYGAAIKDQYNGNIAGMVTTMLNATQAAQEVQGRAFTYDQLYRIKQSLAFHMNSTALSGNAWQSSYTQDSRYRENFTYDWNGNIQTVDRYSGDLVSGTAVKSDQLTYNYAANSNILTRIDDAQGACAYTDDLDDQTGANYTYSTIGELLTDVSERITGIDWNPYGKMKAVHKDQANNTNSCTSTEYADADVEYLYTASQQRLCKIVKPHKAAGAGISDQDDWTYTWYAYDAGGMLMGVYEQRFVQHTGTTWTLHFDVQEHDVYGSGRLGIRKGDEDGKYYQDITGTLAGGLFTSISYTGSSAAFARTHYSREIGNKQYEIANHLGNVLATVSDKRLLYTASPSTATQVDWYTPDVLSYSDYYVFGAPQTGRAGGDYRYGFNGKENDNEVKDVNGSHQDYGMRMYDPRVGRFFSADPLMFAYPELTPYQFASNMPIGAIDLDGMEGKKVNGETMPGISGAGASASAIPVVFSVHQLEAPRSKQKITIPNSVTPTREAPTSLPSHNINSVSHASSEQTVTSTAEEPTEKNVFNPTMMAFQMSADASGQGYTAGFIVGFGTTIWNMMKGLAEDAGHSSLDAAYWSQKAYNFGMLWEKYGGLTEPAYSPNFIVTASRTAVEVENFSSTATPYEWGEVSGKVTAIAGVMVAGRYIPCEGVLAAEGIESEEILLWRVVSVAEREDVLSNGFRAAPLGVSSYEGKLFWTNIEDALWYQKWVGMENPILKIRLQNHFKYLEPGLDAGRPFLHIEGQYLPIFNRTIKSITVEE